jgi:hypothetical protein
MQLSGSGHGLNRARCWWGCATLGRNYIADFAENCIGFDYSVNFAENCIEMI